MIEFLQALDQLSSYLSYVTVAVLILCSLGVVRW